MQPFSISYGRIGRKRHLLWVLPLLLPAIYILAYIGLRVTDHIRPFYNQGGFEMDADISAVYCFSPLMSLEVAWHNKFSPPPTGG